MNAAIFFGTPRSSMKGIFLTTWVPGAGAKKIKNPFFLIIQAKLGFPNAPVCSVNDHPGEINPIN